MKNKRVLPNFPSIYRMFGMTLVERKNDLEKESIKNKTAKKAYILNEKQRIKFFERRNY